MSDVLKHKAEIIRKIKEKKKINIIKCRELPVRTE